MPSFIENKLITIFVLILINLTYNGANAYDDTTTHPYITDKAVKISALKDYLSQNIGIEFSKDFESEINGKTVIEWIMDGSTDEDDPTCRAANHFHDPTKPWDQSQVSDQPGLISTWCKITTTYSTNYSNITWAMGYKT